MRQKVSHSATAAPRLPASGPSPATQAPGRSPRRRQCSQVPCTVGKKLVDAGGLKPNTWQRFERLSSAWEQAKLCMGLESNGAADDEPGVVANPRRRARTPLTESQVDGIRTARANGESVVSICQRFDVHRMTVWTHTRDLLWLLLGPHPQGAPVHKQRHMSTAESGGLSASFATMAP